MSHLCSYVFICQVIAPTPRRSSLFFYTLCDKSMSKLRAKSWLKIRNCSQKVRPYPVRLDSRPVALASSIINAFHQTFHGGESFGFAFSERLLRTILLTTNKSNFLGVPICKFWGFRSNFFDGVSLINQPFFYSCNSFYFPFVTPFPPSFFSSSVKLPELNFPFSLC